MLNSWKRLDQIEEEYGLKQKTLNSWIHECERSPYAKAIVKPTGRVTYIVESIWQDFIKWKCQQRTEKMLDPHIRRKVKSA